MARPKRNSAVLARAERRLESLRSIDTQLDLGGDLSLESFEAVIDDLDAKLAEYNTTLSTVDKMADDVKVSEKAVKLMAEKMLMGVGSRFGRNSQEYQMAGGSRRQGGSSRKVTAGKVEVPAPATNTTALNGASAATTSL